MRSRLLLAVILALGPLACDSPQDAATAPRLAGAVAAPPTASLNQELAQARQATAKYQDLNAALADGYVDINVVVPRMGRHYLRQDLLDATFDPAHPELLVYSPDAGGRMQLVALEYAEPLSGTPPDGFAGDGDRWFPDQQFQLWTLHAWVWRENPAGLFEAFNPRVLP